MKAAVCRTFGEALTIEDITLDPPREGEVQVKLGACAICHSDILYMDGAWGGALPAIYGHEAAGVVEAVGPGVSRAKPGDRVLVTLLRSCGECLHCGQGELSLCDASFPIGEDGRLHTPDGAPVEQGLRTGAFAEQVVVEQSQVMPIPADMPLDVASLLSCGVITGFGAVTNSARMPVGSSAVVIGTGGVGLNSVQGAALSGAGAVIALDLSDDKLEAAKDFGATHRINPGREDAAAAVRALTDGRGADYVFVTVGAKAALDQGLALTRRGGTLVIVGMTAEGVTWDISPLAIADGAQRIIGSKMGSTRLTVDIPPLIALYQQGRLKLDSLISGRYRLDEINEAIDSARRGEALRNVIVF